MGIINHMIYLRTVLFFIIIAIVSILFLILMIGVQLFTKSKYSTRYCIAKLYAKSFIHLLRIVCGLNFQVTVNAKLPTGPAVVIANHQSFWENAAMLLLFPAQSWVLKEELFNIPVFGWGLRLIDPISINRKDFFSVNKILKDGKKKIESGLWMIIFPEATRASIDSNLRFKPSGVKLASIAKVPIVLMIHNAGVFWPPNTLWIKPGTIQVILGPVIEYEEYNMLTIKELNEKVESFITEKKKSLVANCLTDK